MPIEIRGARRPLPSRELDQEGYEVALYVVSGAPWVTMRLKSAALSSPACHAGLEGVCCDPQEKPLGSKDCWSFCKGVRVGKETSAEFRPAR